MRYLFQSYDMMMMIFYLFLQKQNLGAKLQIYL